MTIETDPDLQPAETTPGAPDVVLPADDLDADWHDDDTTRQVRFELEFLTSLIWSPATPAAIEALVGNHAHRADNPNPVDRIPLHHSLFLHRPHARIFSAVIELVDEGSPVTPTIVEARIGTHHRSLRPILLEVAAPTGYGPLPGGTDVPHLARLLVDAWHRRGYSALIARMQLALEHEDTDSLAAHWRTLTDHQEAAERRRLAVTDALARL